MGFIKGNVSFTRFAVRGPKVSMFGEEHLERLHDRQFGHMKLALPDGTDYGWTAGQHVKDTDFEEIKNVYPDHLVWDFTCETNKPPPELIKLYYEVELKALSKDNPSGHPSKRQRKEAKETALARIESEAKDGRFKRYKSVPMLWDAIRNELFVGSTNEKVVHRATTLFIKTFEANLFNPEKIADALHSRTAGRLAASIFPDGAGATLSPFTKQHQEPVDVRWSVFDDEPDFLGNEFLVWLWWKASNEEATARLKDGTDIEWWFSGGVKLEHPTEKSDKDTINACSGVSKPQAFRSLQGGYLPRRAGLTIIHHSEQFSGLINAETLQVTGLKLPKPRDDIEQQRDRENETLGHLRSFVEALDLLFDHFVQLRMSSMWAHELSDIQSWLKLKKGVAA